jgi:hypothetical protein
MLASTIERELTPPLTIAATRGLLGGEGHTLLMSEGRTKMTKREPNCAGEEYGFSAIECDNPIGHFVQIDSEMVELCNECYEAADIFRTAAWAGAYRNR